MANLFKNRATRPPVAYTIMVLTFVIGLLSGASDLLSRESLDGEIEKALRMIVPCERIEIKTKTEEQSGALKSLFIKFVSMPKNCLPADYVTVQYANPQIDLGALKKRKILTVTSYSDYKIGMLVSEQTIRKEFVKKAKMSNFHYDKFLIKFSPPYIEVKFDFPVSAIPLQERKLIEKFIVDDRIKGYAALRLEAQNNEISVLPAKVILNHFLIPAPVLAEIQKKINPVYRIARMRPFEYSLGKVELLKQYILISN